MMQQIYNSYGSIDRINLEENMVKMMGSYNPAKTLACLIEEPEKVREFARSRGQKNSDEIMVSKGITL